MTEAAQASAPDSGAPIVESGEAYATPTFSPEQTAGLAEINSLRSQASDPALDRGQRDVLMQKMSELQRHVFTGGDKPAWFGAQPAAAPDLSEHDSMRESLAGLEKSISPEEVETLRGSAVVRGLHPSTAGAVAKLVGELAMPRQIGSMLLDRVLKHAGAEHDYDALTAAQAFRPLTAEETEEYRTEASRICGGSQRFEALRAEVRSLLHARGLLEGMDRVFSKTSSLAYDPWLLGSLRLWLQSAPTRA
jgi:hypothetical protein